MADTQGTGISALPETDYDMDSIACEPPSSRNLFAMRGPFFVVKIEGQQLPAKLRRASETKLVPLSSERCFYRALLSKIEQHSMIRNQRRSYGMSTGMPGEASRRCCFQDLSGGTFPNLQRTKLSTLPRSKMTPLVRLPSITASMNALVVCAIPIDQPK